MPTKRRYQEISVQVFTEQLYKSLEHFTSNDFVPPTNKEELSDYLSSVRHIHRNLRFTISELSSCGITSKIAAPSIKLLEVLDDYVKYLTSLSELNSVDAEKLAAELNSYNNELFLFYKAIEQESSALLNTLENATPNQELKKLKKTPELKQNEIFKYLYQLPIDIILDNICSDLTLDEIQNFIKATTLNIKQLEEITGALTTLKTQPQVKNSLAFYPINTAAWNQKFLAGRFKRDFQIDYENKYEEKYKGKNDPETNKALSALYTEFSSSKIPLADQLTRKIFQDDLIAKNNWHRTLVFAAKHDRADLFKSFFKQLQEDISGASRLSGFFYLYITTARSFKSQDVLNILYKNIAILRPYTKLESAILCNQSHLIENLLQTESNKDSLNKALTVSLYTADFKTANLLISKGKTAWQQDLVTWLPWTQSDHSVGTLIKIMDFILSHQEVLFQNHSAASLPPALIQFSTSSETIFKNWIRVMAIVAILKNNKLLFEKVMRLCTEITLADSIKNIPGTSFLHYDETNQPFRSFATYRLLNYNFLSPLQLLILSNNRKGIWQTFKDSFSEALLQVPLLRRIDSNHFTVTNVLLQSVIAGRKFLVEIMLSNSNNATPYFYLPYVEQFRFNYLAQGHNIQNEEQNNALHEVAKYSDPTTSEQQIAVADALDILLKKTNPHLIRTMLITQNTHGQTPAYIAASKGNLELVRIFAKYDPTSILSAVSGAINGQQDDMLNSLFKTEDHIYYRQILQQLNNNVHVDATRNKNPDRLFMATIQKMQTLDVSAFLDLYKTMKDNNCIFSPKFENAFLNLQPNLKFLEELLAQRAQQTAITNTNNNNNPANPEDNKAHNSSPQLS